MEYSLEFIKKEDLMNHIEETIKKYEGNLQVWNLKKFNGNVVDPIKMAFDKTVNDLTWKEIIEMEIERQRDKSNTNAIGYFHQDIFKYIKYCKVPEQVWDVIYEPEEDIKINNEVSVKRIKVEMKNKHNTMNSASSTNTFLKLQSELIEDPDCATFLVEAIARRSQNIPWVKTVDKQKLSHDRLRRVSLDRFYEMVTGQKDAFYQLCLVLPVLIKEVFENSDEIELKDDTVFEELEELVDGDKSAGALGIALLMLGFGTYNGFKDS